MQLTGKFTNDSLNENENNRVLIHCNRGQSRSVGIFIMYLMKQKHMTINNAFKYIKERRIQANPGQ